MNRGENCLELIFFNEDDSKKKGCGVGRTSRGKVILSSFPVKKDSLWLCNNIKIAEKFVLVKPVHEVNAEAGVLITAQNEEGKEEEKFLPHENILQAALLDLTRPCGDKWWNGYLAKALSLHLISLVIAGPKVKEVVGLLEEPHYFCSEDTFTLENDNGVKIVVAENASSGSVEGPGIRRLIFTNPVKVGFYIRLGIVMVKRKDLFNENGYGDKEISQMFNGSWPYPKGLKFFWEKLTSYGEARSTRIAVNSQTGSSLMTYSLSKATGGKGWVECESGLVETLISIMSS